MNLLTEQLIQEARNFDELLKWQRGIRVATGIELGEVLTIRDMLTDEIIISFPQYSSLKTASRDGYSALCAVAEKLHSDKAQNDCFMGLIEGDYDDTD